MIDTGSYRINNAFTEFFFVDSEYDAGVMRIKSGSRYNCLISEVVKENMNEYAKEDRASEFYIDLRGVNFVDSSGFSTLNGINKMLAEKGKPTTLVVGPEVKEIIERCDYSNKFDVASYIPDGIEDSIKALRLEKARS